jgi:hypothetical protein
MPLTVATVRAAIAALRRADECTRGSVALFGTPAGTVQIIFDALGLAVSAEMVNGNPLTPEASAYLETFGLIETL